MKNRQKILKWRKKFKLRGYSFLKIYRFQNRIWISKVIKISNKIFPWSWVNQLTNLLLLINSLLPILSEVSALVNTVTNLFHCSSGYANFLYPVNAIWNLLHILQPQISHFILSTLNIWPCIVIQRENRKNPLNYGNSINFSIPLSTHFLVSISILSYPPVPKSFSLT